MSDTTLTLNDKIQKVNKMLKEGEPDNVSVDNFSKYSGYKPQYIIDCLNFVLGIGKWGFKEISNEIVTGQADSQLAICQIKVWIDSKDNALVGWGQSRVTRGDIGDAKKGAQTDALKKALSYFSVGNRAYHGVLKGKV